MAHDASPLSDDDIDAILAACALMGQQEVEQSRTSARPPRSAGHLRPRVRRHRIGTCLVLSPAAWRLTCLFAQ